MSSILPLSLNEVTVKKGKARIIGPVDLELEGTGCTIVIGPNGAGKTTLLRLMHGLEKANSGRVRWNVPKGNAFRRQSFVFQTPVVMRRSVRENIAFPLLVRNIKRTAALLEADKWIEKVGLLDQAAQDARVLSGGERQKLAMARAMIIEPDILFLDEPTTNLDGRATQEIEALIIEARDTGTRIVMATHDFGQARRLGSEILFMHHGVILETGDPAGFFEGPKTPEAETFLKGDILL